MRRRTVLTSAGTVVSMSGCLGDDGNSDPNDEDGGCPDLDLDDELAYSPHEPTRLFEAVDGGIVDVAMLTDPDDAARFDSDLDTEDESFIEETDFGTEAVMALQIGSSGDPTAPVPLGVERDGETIRAHLYRRERVARGPDDVRPVDPSGNGFGYRRDCRGRPLRGRQREPAVERVDYPRVNSWTTMSPAHSANRLAIASPP
ncbi:hypothetical protein [Natronorarus salvus]|uniref:hypothetical protein n=1 Tax=Natronorarus salvus TaxID=3117733 RepID=UPI002F2669E3